MMVFSILAIPLFYLLVMSFFSGRQNRSTSLTPFLNGLLVFFPSFFLTWLLMQGVGESFSVPAIYFYYFLFDSFMYSFFALAGFVLIYRPWKGEEKPGIFRAVGIFAGVFSLLTILEWVTGLKHVGIYALFLLPVVRIVLMLLVPLFVSLGISAVRWLKIPWFAAAAAVPFLTAFVSLFARINYLFSAALTAAFLFTGAVLLFVFLRKRL